MGKYVLTERSELFEPNVYIAMLVDIEGLVKKEKLIKAAQNAFSANESLKSYITINRDGSAEYNRISESKCHVYVTDKNWKDIILENEKKPFAIDKGELLRVFLIHDYYELHKAYWSSRSSVILTYHFTKDEMNSLHSICRKEDVSINSIITATFLKADLANETVGMAVNLRSDKDYSMSNQVSGLSIKLKYDNNMSMEMNAKRFQRKLAKVLSNPSQKYFVLKFMAMLSPTLMDSVLMHIYGLYENKLTDKMSKIMGYKVRKKGDIGLTNLTKLDIPSEYGDYKIKNFIFIPPSISYADHIIGIASMNDGMNLTYHFMNDKNMEQEKEFFDRAIGNIKNVLNDLK